MLKLSLVLAAAVTVLLVAKRENGTLAEKLAYVGRAVFGTRHPSLRHTAGHLSAIYA